MSHIVTTRESTRQSINSDVVVAGCIDDLPMDTNVVDNVLASLNSYTLAQVIMELLYNSRYQDSPHRQTFVAQWPLLLEHLAHHPLLQHFTETFVRTSITNQLTSEVAHLAEKESGWPASPLSHLPCHLPHRHRIPLPNALAAVETVTLSLPRASVSPVAAPASPPPCASDAAPLVTSPRTALPRSLRQASQWRPLPEVLTLTPCSQPLVCATASCSPATLLVLTRTIVVIFMLVASVVPPSTVLPPAQTKPDPRLVVTPLSADGLESALASLGILEDWRHVITGLREGFNIGLEAPVTSTVLYKNHKSCDLVSSITSCSDWFLIKFRCCGCRAHRSYLHTSQMSKPQADTQRVLTQTSWSASVVRSVLPPSAWFRSLTRHPSVLCRTCLTQGTTPTAPQ